MRTRPQRADKTSPADELYTDALDAARRLKKKHGGYFRANPQGFRRQVRSAHSRIFRRKPGPKGDIRIARAARERARGADWPQLYAAYLDGWAIMTEFTRGAAEEGFRKKVTRHPRLRRRSKKRTHA
jgi:hypothetical protein